MSAIKLVFLKNIEILSANFSVVWDRSTDGGSFSWAKCEIVVGTRSYKKDPLYTMSVLSHEIMELILSSMGGRFSNSRTADCYLFNFDHQTFETAIQIHTQALSKFISK